MPLDPRQFELAVLLYVVERHPDHLAPSELIGELSGEGGEDEQLENAIRDLATSDLLRENSGVIEPTDAALRAASILRL